MKNGPKFYNKIIRSHSSRHYKNISPDKTKKLFLTKTKYKELDNNNFNNRYDFNKSPSLSPSFIKNKNKNKIYKNIEISKINNNEKCFMTNKSTFEYNKIIFLLEQILEKDNSFDILIKIKNFIYKLIDNTNDKKHLVNSKSCIEIFSPKENKYLMSSNNHQKKIKFKDENENKLVIEDGEFNEDKNNNKALNNSYIHRHVKKLCNKINKLEEKSNIEQLKYLFFIVEQEKKIAELEKNFELNEIPLDERIIEKMKELKCYPEYIGIGVGQKNYKSSLKKNNLKINMFLKSRNKKEVKKKKYSFDQEIEPINKKDQSIILNKSVNRPKTRKFNFSAKKINFKSNQGSQTSQIIKDNNSETKIKKIEINFSKPINQFFNKKNFFITHPKLNYVKNSLEKNHYLKLKTKEQLSGDTNLLSNMNLASKAQKNAVNDFSSFINNSMANFQKYKN